MANQLREGIQDVEGVIYDVGFADPENPESLEIFADAAALFAAVLWASFTGKNVPKIEGAETADTDAALDDFFAGSNPDDLPYGAVAVATGAGFELVVRFNFRFTPESESGGDAE